MVTTSDLSKVRSILWDQARSGQLSRRELVIKAVAAGLSAPVIAGMMTAFQGQPALAAQPAAPSGPEALQGNTYDITILGIAGWPPSELGSLMATEIFKPYANETLGYDVNFSFEGAPFESLFQKAATSLQAGSADYNIIISDSQWLGALAEPGWIVQLNDIIAANPDLDIEFEPAAQAAYRIYPDGSDQLWGFPQEADTIALFVRQDLMSDQSERDAYLAANDGEDLPQTFDEWLEVDIDRYERIAAHFTRPDENLYGAAMQWSKVYDYLTCYAYPFMFSNGGEVWDPATGQVEGILDSQINADGLARNKSFLQYAPEGATNYGIGELIDVFPSGILATTLQWSAVGPQMLNQAIGEEPGTPADPDRPVRPEDVLIVPPPGFTQADGSLNRVYTLGGQPWVINAFNNAEQMQVAIDFMKWWYLPETQLEFARRGGNPADVATLNSEGFDQIQPHFPAYKYMIQESRGRDFWHDPNYAEMLSVQQEAWSAYITDSITDPMQALLYTACAQQGILYDDGRSDIEPSDACADVTL